MEQITDLLLSVRESVFAYYSRLVLEQTSPAIAALEPAVEKPEEITLLENLLALGMMPVAGGYFDQPWLLMKSMEAAAAGKAMFQASDQRGENK